MEPVSPQPARRRTPVLIFLALAVLTVGELLVIGTDASRAARITALSGLAMVKASLVLLFFMHLRAEARSIKLSVMAPLVLAPALVVVLMLDTVFRLTGGR